MGDYYFSRGVYNRAFSLYCEALKYSNRVENIYEKLGNTCLNMGDSKEALYFFRYGARYFPADFRSYVSSARILAEYDMDKARLYGKKALSAAPEVLRENVQQTLNRVWKRFSADQMRPGSETAAGTVAREVAGGNRGILEDTAVRLGMNERTDVLRRAAQICLEQGDTASALVILQKTAQIRGESSVYIRMGNICFENKTYSKAVLYYLMYSRKNPGSGIGYYNTGVVYLVKGFNQRADMMFEKAGERFSEAAAHTLKTWNAGGAIHPLSAGINKLSDP